MMMESNIHKSFQICNVNDVTMYGVPFKIEDAKVFKGNFPINCCVHLFQLGMSYVIGDSKLKSKSLLKFLKQILECFTHNLL